ncbi:MAG TPA: hypothetical protein VFK96_00165 [Gammaproteobacteria bacterium]|nr:hypothetical protein [Gammaproteobacteria bacterium]
MRYIFALTIAVGGLLLVNQAWADGNCGQDAREIRFVRADMVTLKGHMKKVLEAVGTLPAPYARKNDDWQLPASACRGKRGFRPIFVEYSGRFSVEQNQEKLQQEYQKKIMAAEASGNYQAISKLAAQMQSAMMASSVVAQNATPVDISIMANRGGEGSVDPDAVVRDGAGFIALRQQGGSDDNETVVMYFDKVQLKDAHQLASYNLDGDWRVPEKLSLINIKIQISGSKANVERLVKQIDAAAVLNQLSTERVTVGMGPVGC